MDEFWDALGGDIAVPGLERSGALTVTEILATRGWFDQRRRKLTSSGGRPTNPDWTMKRQVPLAPDTWDTLKALANKWSDHGRRLGPGQVAGFLLEEIVALATTEERFLAASGLGAPDSAGMTLDPRFTQWKMPEPFAGRAA